MTQAKTFAELMERMPRLLAPSLARDWPNLPIDRAEGMYLFDTQGRRYLDFTAGLAVMNVGHCHPRVVAAAQAQTARMIHSAVGVTQVESLLRLAEALIEVLPPGLDTFFFSNSGSEAIEGALKLARYATGRPGFIAFWGGFHGRTLAAAALTTSKGKYRRRYEPMLPGVYFADYPYCYRCPLGKAPETCQMECMRSLDNLFERAIAPSEVAAIIVEPVQGEAGFVVPPPDFLHHLRRICDEHGILLIFDEIQTGFGRTGQMFAAQTFGVTPDVMAIAKSIGSGFPLSAVVASRDLMEKWGPASHSTTFGGNPVAAAAGLAVLDVIREENLLENCRRMGQKLLAGARDLQNRYPIIGDVRGVGLMVGLEMVIPDGGQTPNPDAARNLLNECLSRGLLLYSAGLYSHVIRIFPPLIVNDAQIDEALHILDESLAACG
ncbi:MAG: aminotransferase class III-fold pyridoxal phosphate-dependent enzyme [Chloroflexi bacterium]|nr:MAG: aminotransferase class III-fold pyridoxal phosphate-dependent enzyme [Chloroflexota bacterium]